MVELEVGSANERMALKRVMLLWVLGFFVLLSALSIGVNYPEEPYKKGNLLRAVINFDSRNLALVRVLLGSFKRAYLSGFFLEIFEMSGRKVCDGPLSLEWDHGTLLTCQRDGKVLRVKLEGDRLIAIASGAIKVTASSNQWRTLGAVMIANSDSGLNLINYIYLEEYLKGVLPYEMPPSWPTEALKAQAVAARTYAVRTTIWRRERGKSFDLRSTVADQVYHGMDGWQDSTNYAVDATRGYIVVYRGKPIYAFYSADCGGHTQDGELVFKDKLGGEGAPYLKPVKCIHVGKRWRVRLSPEEVRRALRKYLPPNSEVISLADADPYISVLTTRGSVRIHKAIFRKLTGYKLRSSLYSLSGDMRKGYVFIGRGLGHGVGMCQWGARDMALRGYTYEDILKHYYRGVDIVPVYKIFSSHP